MRGDNTRRLSKKKATNRHRRMIRKIMNNIQKVACLTIGGNFKWGEGNVNSVNLAATGSGAVGATIFASEKRLFVFIKVGEMIVPEFDHAIIENGNGSIVVTSVI